MRNNKYRVIKEYDEKDYLFVVQKFEQQNRYDVEGSWGSADPITKIAYFSSHNAKEAVAYVDVLIENERLMKKLKEQPEVIYEAEV